MIMQSLENIYSRRKNDLCTDSDPSLDLVYRMNATSLKNWEVFFVLLGWMDGCRCGLSPWHHASRDRLAEIEPNDSSLWWRRSSIGQRCFFRIQSKKYINLIIFIDNDIILGYLIYRFNSESKTLTFQWSNKP